MKNIYIIIVFLIFILSICFDLYLKNKKNKFNKYILSLLIEKNFKKFDEVINGEEAKKLIPKYNLMYLQFNSFILRNEKEKADQIFQQMLDQDFTNKQKIIFYGKALNYYIEQKDSIHAAQCYNKIKKIEHNDHEKNRLISIYKVRVLNDFNCLDKIINRISEDNPDEKVTDYYLISYIYKKQNNNKMAKKYNKLADDMITNIVS